jgi:hypothetical protein
MSARPAIPPLLLALLLWPAVAGRGPEVYEPPGGGRVSGRHPTRLLQAM